MVETMQCKYCDTTFPRKVFDHFSIRCPHCYRLLEHSSRSEHGPITPFYICIGDRVAGIVRHDDDQYYLDFQNNNIVLTSSYLNAVHEAEDYILNALHLSINKVETNIVTKSGSLWFFGDSFGRPYDNVHTIRSIHYDGELLTIIFDKLEELLIYHPEDIQSTNHELRIEKASKVKWSYLPYGSTAIRCNIIYQYIDNEVTKITEKGETVLTDGENSPAVQLVNCF